FEQEAQAAGTLNHPNILSIYDVATHDGSLYVVSELLEGETLRERLDGTALPSRKAIDYALQTASGLAAAHDKGIVHRDLKPENLFITRDGRVKILDFGLAKLIEPKVESEAQTDVPTRIIHTDPGAVMGTAGYMSPEQVRGRSVDHRSDIFAFGTVLYEMLSGNRAFKGESAVETLNAILKEDPPDISASSSNVPPALERVVRHCLEKSPEERFQSARDLAFALEAVSGFSGSHTRAAADIVAPPSVRHKSRERLAWIIVGVMLLGLLAALPFAISYFRRAPMESGVVRFPVSLPENTTFETDVETHNLSISPDGRRLAFIAKSEGQKMLWVRSLDALSAQALPDTEGAISPFWSPDSRYLAFFAKGKLKKVEAAGGSPQTVCNLSAETDAVGTWGRDGTILFATDIDTTKRGIFSVAAAGGAPTLLMKNDDANNWIHFLPDGRHFLFGTNSEQNERDGIYVGSIGSAETKQLVQTSYTRAEYAPPGYLLYVRDSTLLAQEFDAANLRLTGEPFAVVERLPYFDKTGWAEFSVSENGVLAHMNNIWTTRLVWFDRGGREMGEIGAAGEHYDPRLSPDGQKVAMTTTDRQTGSGDLWIHDLARDTRTRFTVGASDDSVPVWSPDGRQLAFFSCCESGKSTLRIKDLSDTTSTGQSPFQSGFNVPFDWSSDGRFILYSQNEPTTTQDVWVLPLSGEQKPFPFLQTQFDEKFARFSPDGRWVAFMSNESGRDEVYVTRFDQPGEKWRISTAGGRSPRWRRDGKELFYLAADKKMMSVIIKSGAETFEAGAPTALFKVDSILEGDYDVTADGQRFLINNSVAGAQSQPFTIVLNWAADLKR
ncbi:MAG: protein kinase domain-containing protein, partial [Aridibacter sp.]